MVHKKEVFIILFFTLSFSTSCYSSTKLDKIPIKSFAKIYQNIEIIKCKPKSNICKERSFTSIGSGSIVKKEQNKMHILTAGHVCDVPEWSDDIAKEILQAQNRMVVQLYDNSFHEAKILASTNVNITRIDLCILEILHSDEKIEPLKVSKKPPKVGDRVYSMAAPAGIYHPPTVPIFDGIYSGPMPDGKNAMTTIPAVGGSSGAVVLNSKLEIISVLFATHPAFTHSSLVNSYENTKNFIYETLYSSQCKMPNIKDVVGPHGLEP
jgi:hypothetical protein